MTVKRLSASKRMQLVVVKRWSALSMRMIWKAAKRPLTTEVELSGREAAIMPDEGVLRDREAVGGLIVRVRSERI